MVEKTDDMIKSEPSKALAHAQPDPDSTNRADEPAEIKRQIAETRHQMGETIDAIQDRLSFSNISEQVSEHVSNAVDTAKDAVYDATLGKAVKYMKNAGNEIADLGVVQTARNNPLPLALIGLGAGLLVYKSMTGKKAGNGFSRKALPSGEHDGSLSIVTDAREINGKSSKPGLTDKISDTAGNVYSKVSDTAGTVYSKVGDAVDSAYNRGGAIAENAFDKAGQLKVKAGDTFGHYLEEKPLALAAVALAAGAAVGMAFPSTRYEADLMGQAREDLLQKAENAASGLLNKTKQVVGEAGKAVSDETRSLTN